MAKKMNTKQLTKAESDLVKKNVGYAAKVVRKFANDAHIELKGNDDLFCDLKSVAYMSMINCVGRFTVDAKRASFKSFCYPYIMGQLAHHIDKEYCRLYQNNGQLQKAKFASLDEQLGDEEDSYTRLESIVPLDYADSERHKAMKEAVAIILDELEPEEVDMVRKVFWSQNRAEAIRQIVNEKHMRAEYVNDQVRALVLKMGEIAISKGITNNF